jgi:hypothetical protein
MIANLQEVKAPVSSEIAPNSEIIELLESQLAFVGGGIGETAI